MVIHLWVEAKVLAADMPLEKIGLVWERGVLYSAWTGAAGAGDDATLKALGAVEAGYIHSCNMAGRWP